MDFYRPPTTQGTLDALGGIYRTLRAWKFYPKGHPARRSSLNLAHGAMLKIMDGNAFSLACGRTGFSFPDGEPLKDPSKMSTSLAYELFVRRVQKITFSHDLFQEDLLELLNILCLTPEVIQQSGGIDTLMAARGIRSIWVNEFDLAAIRGKRQRVEQSGIVPQGIDEAETAADNTPAAEQQKPRAEPPPSEQQLEELLVRIATCADETIYPRLVNRAVDCAGNIHEAEQLFPLLELLSGHASDEMRGVKMRDSAQFALEQIVTGGGLLKTVIELTAGDAGVSRKALQAVLKAGGAAAVTAGIEFMGRTGSLKARKSIATALGALGEAAVPALLNLLEDSRWFITRNICAILGVIASGEAVAPVAKCLHHPDPRVQKEAIRSLALIGGHGSEEAILAVLRGTDAAIHPQAIASLGGMKSRKALPELLRIVFSKEMFLKSLPLKIDALAAIALIGDPQVTPHLVRLLEERHLLAAERGRQMKAAVASCLGRLGDTRAIPSLKRLASDSGAVGSACSDAIAMIEKTEGRPDGIS